MEPLSMTLGDLWPEFKITTLFEVKYLRDKVIVVHK